MDQPGDRKGRHYISRAQTQSTCSGDPCGRQVNSSPGKFTNPGTSPTDRSKSTDLNHLFSQWTCLVVQYSCVLLRKQDSKEKSMGRRLGLILGINQYQDATFRRLQFAETDARALAQWLVNTRGGNWAPADLQLVLGAQATRELTVSLISQVCLDVAEPGDLVFIYFAGHASLDVTSGEGYLALANTRYQNPTTELHLAT